VSAVERKSLQKTTFALLKISWLLRTYCPEEISIFSLELSRRFSYNNVKWFEECILTCMLTFFILLMYYIRCSIHNITIITLNTFRCDKKKYYLITRRDIFNKQNEYIKIEDLFYNKCVDSRKISSILRQNKKINRSY